MYSYKSTSRWGETRTKDYDLLLLCKYWNSDINNGRQNIFYGKVTLEEFNDIYRKKYLI